MKFLVTGDWHGDWRTHGVSRFQEVSAAVAETVAVAIQAEVDGYVFLGDLTNPDSGSTVFRVMQMALSAAKRLQGARIPSYWIAGNHDVIEDGTGGSTLAPLYALGRDVNVFDEGCIFGNRIVALPFTATARAYEPAKVDFPENAIVFSHMTHVPGITPGEETTEMPRGREVTLPLAKLRERKCAVVFQGHFHRQQELDADGFRVIVPGSLARLTFCEEANQPGFLIAEVP